MTTNNLTLYRVLTKLGVNETEAENATTFDAATMVTKADLAELRAATRADLAELKADLIKWNVGTLVTMTGLVAVLKLFG
jgi:hypothetical protein